jgi:hypothetical protein
LLAHTTTGIFLTFLYVINLPVLWVEHRETSADLSNNYNHNLPVFNSPDRIYNANFTETLSRQQNVNQRHM